MEAATPANAIASARERNPAKHHSFARDTVVKSVSSDDLVDCGTIVSRYATTARAPPISGSLARSRQTGRSAERDPKWFCLVQLAKHKDLAREGFGAPMPKQSASEARSCRRLFGHP